MPRAERKHVQDIKFPIPPLNEQMRIASILGNLDKKINILHEQNKILEKI